MNIQYYHKSLLRTDMGRCEQSLNVPRDEGLDTME